MYVALRYNDTIVSPTSQEYHCIHARYCYNFSVIIKSHVTVMQVYIVRKQYSNISSPCRPQTYTLCALDE